jgi:hypothetical protein
MAKTPTNLEIEQGTTFSVLAVWKDVNGNPVDLSNYTARMQIRSSYASNTIAESLTTSNNEISLSSEGEITMSLPPNRTSAIFVDYTQTTNPPRTKYVYDLELVSPDAVVTRLLFGTVVVIGEVTR